MLSHYVKVAFRGLLKHKGHSLINILGLALGMACCLLILLFLRDEVGYDRFHERADRVFRITHEVGFPKQPVLHAAITPISLAPALRKEMPEIAAATRLIPYFEGSLPGKAAVSYRTGRDERQFYEAFFWADPDIFRVFTFPLVAGNPQGQLAAPNTVVLSESAARKYFGDEPALGKTLRIDSGFSDEGYKVTGVVRDLPYNSHFHFDLLVSFSSLEHVKDPRVVLDAWWLSDVYTYVRLADNATPQQVEEKFPAFVKAHFPEIEGATAAFFLQPLADIHQRSHLMHELEVNGDVSTVYMFSAIALLTLLIACVNFMNLSTARYAHRAREVGMRKALGARRGQLVQQFLGESFVLAVIAMVLAVFLVWATLPAFNAFSGKRMAMDFGGETWLALLALTVFVGVVAGSYPAFFLSSFQPLQVINAQSTGTTRSVAFRRVLIVLQFTISVALLIATGVVYDQLRYMRSQELGFDMENVVVLPLRDVKLRDRFLEVKDEMAKVPGVTTTTFTSLVVGRETPQIGILVKDMPDMGTIGTLVVDYDFLKVFKVPLVAGRDFSRQEPEDVNQAFLLNEAAAKSWGFEKPEEVIGRKVAWGGWKVGEIVGVVKNFHHEPLQHEIEPLILHVRPITFHYMYARINPENMSGTLEGIEKVWRRMMPTKPFEYFFLDDEFDRAYRSQERLGQLIGLFALITIFVACLGLLGLTSFTAERRTREIGIRKALGSSVGRVVVLLSRELTVLVLLANLIAWPVAYMLLKDWLQAFPYRTPIHLLNFVLGGLAALAIAWLTVSYQALKAARIDAAKALRYE
jgi:putative ABC transport system permease protein